MLALYLFSKAAKEGPDTSLAWIFLLGLGLFFLMIVIGWVAGSMRQSRQDARNRAQK